MKAAAFSLRFPFAKFNFHVLSTCLPRAEQRTKDTRVKTSAYGALVSVRCHAPVVCVDIAP